MGTSPTRVSYNTPPSGNFSTAAGPKTTGTFDVQANDLIVVLASLENAASAAVVTPASGGSVAWAPLLPSQNAGGIDQSAAYGWVGVVGATAAGISVALDRPSSDASLFWGMSATVWRDHGGIGSVFSGSNGTSATAPSVAAACRDNSAVQCQINDWTAADGAGRTWRTINGSPQSESAYFRDAARHAVHGGYTLDTGPAATITQGLTTPTMRWVLIGVEILGLPVQDEATKYQDATAAMTAGMGF